MLYYIVQKVQAERRGLRMRNTTEKEIIKAIRVYKEKYGIKTPLDMFVLDKIIDKLRGENK